MSDAADVASETVDTCNAEARRRWSKQAAPESQPNWLEFNGYQCVDCFETVPPARLILARIRCVSCQSDLERARK